MHAILKSNRIGSFGYTVISESAVNRLLIVNRSSMSIVYFTSKHNTGYRVMRIIIEFYL